MKAWLSRAGVPFTAFNVDEDDRAYDELLARGHRTIPVTIFGFSSRRQGASGEAKAEDRTIIGFDPDALADATAAWREQTHDPGRS